MVVIKQISIFILCMFLVLVTGCTKSEGTIDEPTVSPNNTIQPTESDKPTESTANSLKYQSQDGWSILYPSTWDYTSNDTLRESETEKYISFSTLPLPAEGVEQWLDAKIKKTVAFEEADNKLVEDLTNEEKDGFTVYKYMIESTYGDNQVTELRFIFYVDNEKIYEFHSQSPPLPKNEFEAIVKTFSKE